MPDMHVRASLMDKVKLRHTVCNPNEDKRVAAPTQSHHRNSKHMSAVTYK